MASLSWLRLARRIPGLARQPELPNLEALIEAEGQKPGDDFLIARWVVPLVLTVVAVAVFTPLAILVEPWLGFFGAGLIAIGGILGLCFHAIAKAIPPSRVVLRKRSRKLLERMCRVKHLLGLEPVLAPEVGSVLDEAARLYLKSATDTGNEARTGVWEEARERAMLAMEEAMGRLLELAEPDNAQAQEIALSRGWAQPLLNEMAALGQALDRHAADERLAKLTSAEPDALAGLRSVRDELERIESAESELDRYHQTN